MQHRSEDNLLFLSIVRLLRLIWPIIEMREGDCLPDVVLSGRAELCCTN